MESSQKINRLPSINSGTGNNFILAIFCRKLGSGGIKLRGHVGVYFTNGRAKRIPLSKAYPIACATPESGIPAT